MTACFLHENAVLLVDSAGRRHNRRPDPMRFPSHPIQNVHQFLHILLRGRLARGKTHDGTAVVRTRPKTKADVRPEPVEKRVFEDHKLLVCR